MAALAESSCAPVPGLRICPTDPHGPADVSTVLMDSGARLGEQIELGLNGIRTP